METMKNLKLYVWEGFCPDYTDGLAFAIASSQEEAEEMILKIAGSSSEHADWGTCSVHRLDRKIAKSVCGGG